MSAVNMVRDIMRKNILAFKKGNNFQKDFYIVKPVIYNDIEYPCIHGIKCKDDRGFWKMGVVFTHSDKNEYTLTHYTVVSGTVEISSYVKFNSKLTVTGGKYNTFYVSRHGLNYFTMSKTEAAEYLLEWLTLAGAENFMSSGYTFYNTLEEYKAHIQHS